MSTSYLYHSKSMLCAAISSSAMCYSAGTANAADNMVVTLENMHLWRGMEVTDGLVITAESSLELGLPGLRLGVWGGTNTKASYKEFDYFLSYEKGPLKCSIWDIYNFSPSATYNNKDIFDYTAHGTGRFIDATVQYKPSPKVPLTLSWSTIFFGRDRDGMNAQNRYSTFVYAEYVVWKNENWDVKPGIGGALALAPGKDALGNSTSAHFYGSGPGIVQVNLACTYHWEFWNQDHPITLTAFLNPQSNNGYLQLVMRLLSF